jgi:hypothetical protein
MAISPLVFQTMSGTGARQSRPRPQQPDCTYRRGNGNCPEYFFYHRVALILADAIDCLIATTKGLPPMRTAKAARYGKT